MNPCPKPVKREPRPRKELRRKRYMRKRAPRRLSRAGSDPARLEWVRQQPCIFNNENCFGRIHAHHAGRRPGVGLKAPDDTAIPLCLHHHACWHAGLGIFAGWNKMERFAWSMQIIAQTQARYAGGAVRGREP